jgi:hypothetical protein
MNTLGYVLKKDSDINQFDLRFSFDKKEKEKEKKPP